MRLLSCTLLILLIASPSLADNWPNWRGPNGNSVGPAGDFPANWSPTENVVWKLKLPGKGSSTPAVWEDNIFVTYNVGSDANLVACLDRRGKERWKVELGSAILGKYGVASGANPSPVTDGTNVQTILVLGADYVTGHDAASGKELWKFGTLNPNHEQYWRSIASAAIADGYLFAPYARGGSLTAIKLGGRGDVTESHAHWMVPGISSDCATPIAANGKVYSGTDRGKLTCVDIATGEISWQLELEKSGRRYKSSPILAGGKLYWAREDGTVFVIDVGDKPAVVGTNAMGEQIVATPVLVDGQVLLRTLDTLYLIGK